MTREEAKNKFENVAFDCNRNDKEKVLLLRNAENIVDIIFDDFESKVCENCSKFKDGNCRIFQGAKCKCTLYVITEDNFCCNMFERKEDERN